MELSAQQVDLEHIGDNFKKGLKKKLKFKYSGGVSLNTVFYNGNIGSGREPFNYFITGNFNVSLASLSIPISFNYTNSGFSYNYQFPRLPRRLSLNPKYKWIQAHIGDVSMSFSPYTFNGYLFQGVGFDLKPKGDFSYSFFYGRLQKSVQYVPSQTSGGNTLAAYKRMGYGLKVNYDNPKIKLGASVFSASDIENSLIVKPDSIAIYPQDNTAIGLETSLPIFSKIQLKVEYGLSALTRDKRSQKLSDSSNPGLLYKTFGARQSLNIYHAVKGQLNYTIGTSQVGVGLERIDPGYQTLGAYYFNNDLQNITLNFAQNLFKGKISLSTNIGLQQDNLDSKKASASNRTVIAANVNWNASQRLSISTQYSNFRSFTNIRPQFQYINQLTPFDNLDTLNFYQLSQNANMNVNYVISKDKESPKNLNVNLSLQDAFDEQGGTVAKGNSSTFYNLASSYSQTKSSKYLTWVAAFNVTYNTIGKNNIVTLGPTINVTKGFMKNALKSTASVSYNQTSGVGTTSTKVACFRINGAYTLMKKHNLGLNITSMFKNGVAAQPLQRDITGSINYSLSL
jgi:hypothetical protein